MTRDVYILGYGGELSVKARGTRNRFCERLARNLADALASAQIPHRIRRTWSRLYVESPSPGAAEVASRVFGVSSVAPAARRPWETLEDVLRDGEEIFAPAVAGRTFAVRVRRGGGAREQAFTSPEVERRLGSRLLPGAAGVDLENPQVEARVELRRGEAYYSSERIAAHGGLPVGTEGRALVLFSGGFDSAVAAWRMLRRGVKVDYLFLNLAGDAHRDAVLAVAKVLADRWSYGSRPQLHLVDFAAVAAEIKERCPQPLWQVVLKRRMLRAAEKVARRTKAAAIVTGEAVGQVSSQTLQNLAVIQAACEMPILRPVVSAHKEEILEQARTVGTHDLSVKVAEHCALTPRAPATHARADRVERAEAALDAGVLDALIEERAVFDLRALDLARISAPDLEVDRVPEGAVVVDLRSGQAFRSWHLPGALSLGYVEALAAFPSFDRERTYLFYCEVGLKSAHLAELMSEAGFRAHCFRGGLKRLMRSVAGDEALRAALSPALLSDE